MLQWWNYDSGQHPSGVQMKLCSAQAVSSATGQAPWPMLGSLILMLLRSPAWVSLNSSCLLPHIFAVLARFVWSVSFAVLSLLARLLGFSCIRYAFIVEWGLARSSLFSLPATRP